MRAGDAAGLVHIMDVPRGLKRRSSSESKALTAMVQREVARLIWLTAHVPSAASAPAQVPLSAALRGILHEDAVPRPKHCDCPMYAGKSPRACSGRRGHANGPQEVTAGPAGGKIRWPPLHCLSVRMQHHEGSLVLDCGNVGGRAD